METAVHQATNCLLSKLFYFYADNKQQHYCHTQKVNTKINIHDYGSAALHYAMLASAHIDAMMSASQKAHELAAGYLMAKESGAILTDLDGNPLDNTGYDFNKKYPVIGACTKELHAEILTAIKQ